MTNILKATLVVTAADGTVWSGEVELRSDIAARPRAKSAQETAAPAETSPVVTASDLKLPARAFLSKFASKASSPGKFTLVVAQIARGAVGREISASEIEKVWNQNSGVLGGRYQRIYGTRSKEKGWVDSASRGKFVLMNGWEQAANG